MLVSLGKLLRFKYPLNFKNPSGLVVLIFICISGLVSCTSSEPDSKFKIHPSNKIIQAEQFELNAVHLLDSPFRQAKERDGKYLLSLNPDRLLAPYWKEAGISPESSNYGGWENTGLDGHSLGHYLSAVSMISATNDNPEFRKISEHIVAMLAVIQDSIGTGYVAGIPNGKQIFDEIAAGNIQAEPFGLNEGWVPWYNIHKLFAGLRDAYLYTDNNQAREVLVKLSDWAVNLSSHLTNEQFAEMLTTEFGGMNEVLADVFAITGSEKYLDLAQRFNDKNLFIPLSKSNDELAGLHANTQIPKIIGAAREYEFTGEDTLKKVAVFFWETVIQNRTYANGGNSLNEHFGEPGSLESELGKSASETCNTYNMLKLTEHLMKWDPYNPKYASYYEKALYNHILASQDPDTGMFCYFIPLVSGHFKTFSSPENSFWCCVGSGMENHAKYAKNIYLHTDSAIFVNLFIPSEVNWKAKGITLRQETDFPNSQKTKLLVQSESPVNFDLKIRQPQWATSDFEIRINGKIFDISDNDYYITINRDWSDRDSIEISLPMDLHLETLGDNPKKAAIKYGPILLAGMLGNSGMDEDPIPYAGFEGFDGRWDHRRYEDMETVPVPPLKTNNEPVNNWIIPVEGKPLHFKTAGVGISKDVELAPFYEINHQRYAVYWDLNLTSE